jgi:hypothetical protein
VFSIVEGSVDTKTTLVNPTGSLTTALTGTAQITVPKAGKLTRLTVTCATVNNFNVFIYRHSGQLRTDMVLAGTTEDGTLDLAANLTYISNQSKFYVVISHLAAVSADFDIGINIEVTKSA